MVTSKKGENGAEYQLSGQNSGGIYNSTSKVEKQQLFTAKIL